MVSTTPKVRWTRRARLSAPPPATRGECRHSLIAKPDQGRPAYNGQCLSTSGGLGETGISYRSTFMPATTTSRTLLAVQAAGQLSG
jgi:hypothetical protein